MIRLLLALVVLLTGCQAVSPVNTPFQVRIEAEDPRNLWLGSARVAPCAWCSGKTFVDGLGEKGAIVFLFEVPQTGLYRLDFRYSLGFPASTYALLSLGETPVKAIEFRPTGAWERQSTSSAVLPLRRGLNRVGVLNPDAWTVGLDHLVVASDVGAGGRGVARQWLLWGQPVATLADLYGLGTPIGVLGLGAVVALVTLVYVVTRPGALRRRENLLLAALVMATGVALGGYLAELIDESFLGSRLGYLLRYAALALLSVLALAYALTYAGVWRIVPVGIRAGLLTFSLFVVVVYATDPWLHLAQSRPLLSLQRPYLPLIAYGNGFGHQLALTTSLIFNLLALGALVSIYARVSALYRAQIVILLGALLSPLVLGLLFGFPLAKIGYAQGLDWLMFGLVGTALGLAVAVFAARLLRLTPAAWGMTEWINQQLAIVVDCQGNILEGNPTARQELQVRPGDALRTHLPIPAEGESQGEVVLGGRHYEVHRSALPGGAGEYIALQDVSARVRQAQELAAQHGQLLALQAELRNQALRDGLTGLYNRRFLDQELARQLAASGEGGELSLVLLDLDRFRDINTRYGYAGGDAVLRQFAAFLRRHRPPGAPVCRYGGEEFCVLLPGTSLGQAEALAQDWQELMRHEVIDVGPARVRLSFSAACASLTEQGPAGLLLAADDALREAKRLGRNRVVRAKVWNPQWGRGWI